MVKAVIAALLLLSTILFAQQTPVFRSSSALVEVDAVVTDKSGAAFRGLTRDDFVVTDNGVPQDVVQFSFVDITPPETAAASVEPPVDVVTNTPRADRRVYAIVLDAFHIDPSRSTVVRKLARQFVDNEMGPSDMAAVVQLGPTTLNQSFTSDKALLDAAIEKFIGRKPESATLGLLRDAMLRPQTPDAPAEHTESGTRAAESRILLETITQLCRHLGAVQGHRRSIILFGEGIDYPTADLIGGDQRPGGAGYLKSFDPAKHAGEVLSAESDMLDAARRADVALYTVDPRGNTMGDEEIMQVSGRTPPGASFAREAQRGQGTERTFSFETGGFAVVGTSDFKTGFARIVQANSSYYVLGYRPSGAQDGAYHKIDVTVKSHDVEVAARRGYFAVAAAPVAASPAPAATASNVPSNANAPSTRMRELLSSPLPVAGLRVRVTGGPVRPDGDKVLTALVMELDTRDVDFTESNGELSDDIEMAFVAIDAAGKVLASNRSVGNLRLPVAQRAAIGNGLRYVAEFALPPGRYQIRAGAFESAGGTAGSAILDVDTDDLARQPLSIGTILVTAGQDQAMPTTGSFQVLHGLLPGPPTATRAFTPQDTLVTFADVSDNGQGSGGADAITTVVKDATGREMFTNTTSHDRAELSPKKHGVGFVARVPLSRLAAGSYTLTMSARTPAGRSASKSVGFVVR